MKIGIDIGGTNLVAGLVDDCFRLVDKENTLVVATKSDGEIVEDIIKLCKNVMHRNNLKEEDIQSIGIGVPGCYDPEKGIIVYCENINLCNTPIVEMIRREIDVPVYLGNDADCAALGEAYAGATKDAKDSIMVTIGTGIGGGIIINRKLYNGFNHCGGELGHMVIGAGTEQCGCGRKGCWEAYASATALIRQTREAICAYPSSTLAEMADGDLEKVNGKTAFDAMRAGCPVGTSVVEQYIEYLAIGITNIVNIFQPQMLVLGGGISKEGQFLVNSIMKHVAAERYGKEYNIPETVLCTAVLGNDAGVIGAAALGV